MKAFVFENLREEYIKLFNTCEVLEKKLQIVDDVICNIFAGRLKYSKVAEGFTDMPWYFIGLIHNMECGGNFNKHLHNGDPLTAKTKRIPSGRPLEPPWNNQRIYTWEQSAIDALKMKKLDGWANWSISGMLYQLEKYNGFGYRIYHPHVKTPYLWSFTNHYIRGKYVADGMWSETAVSGQVGCAAVLKRMEKRNLLI